MPDQQPSLDLKILESLRDLQTTDDDPQFFKNYLTEVLDGILPRMSSIQEAIGRLDFTKVKLDAHALRSSCANSGFIRLTALCGEL